MYHSLICAHPDRGCLHRSAGGVPGVWHVAPMSLERMSTGHCAGSSPRAYQVPVHGPGMITIFLAPKGGTRAGRQAHASIAGQRCHDRSTCAPAPKSSSSLDPCSHQRCAHVRPLLANLPRRSALVGSCRHRGTRRPGAASRFAGRGRSERPIFRTKLALGSPNLSCLSPVCWLFRLRAVDPPQCKMPAFRVTAAIMRDPRPSEGLFYHDPVPSPVPCHLLHTSSCPTILSATPSSSAFHYPQSLPWYSCESHRCAPSPPTDLAPEPSTCCLTLAFTSAADPVFPGCTAATPID